MKLIIDARHEGYGTDQVKRTMTVGDLIEYLEQFDEDMLVYLGFDPKSYGWYTYGGITEGHFNEINEEDEDE